MRRRKLDPYPRPESPLPPSEGPVTAVTAARFDPDPLQRVTRGYATHPKSDERFLTRAMVVGLSVYAAFALTFSYFQIKGDALVYFNLMRRFFGERLPEGAVAYQFGSTLWNTPFFLVGKLLASIFGYQPKIFHVSFQEIAITVATNAAFLTTLYLGWRILRELQLPRNPAVLLLTAFGTPLFYYVVFDPAGKHAVDTLAVTAAAYVALRTHSSRALRWPIALGVLAGWAVNIRVVNAAFFIVLFCALLLQRRALHAGVGALAALSVAPLILVLPALRGIPYLVPEQLPFRGLSATEETGWKRFNGANIRAVESPELAAARTVEVMAAADGDGAYADVAGLVPGGTYSISVQVRGSANETVTALAESPVGTFKAYLGSGRILLSGSWQRLEGIAVADASGGIRVIVTSRSGSQRFRLSARDFRARAPAIPPESVTERTGWTGFNAGVLRLVEIPKRAGADTIEATAANDGDGAFADVSGLVPGTAYDVGVYVRGAVDEAVVALAESPIGTFKAYLSGGRTPLRESWQRVEAAVVAAESGTVRVIVASQSGAQAFYISGRSIRPRDAAVVTPKSTARRSLASVSGDSPATPKTPGLAAQRAVLRRDHARVFDQFDATIPIKMLASEHRGLFLWTPLSALALLGYILALRDFSRMGRPERRFLAALLVAGIALLCSHVIWRQWDGGFAFSQRFLTALFPIYLIGVAELLRRARNVVFPLLVGCVLFSVAIAFVHDVGYDGISERDGLARHVEAGWDNRRSIRQDVQDDAKARWVYLWGLLEGRDSKCINEPPGTTEC